MDKADVKKLRITLLCFFCLVSFLTQVCSYQHAGTLYCPDTSNEDEKVTMVFLLDESKFPSVCTGATNHEARFEQSPNGAGNTYSKNCSVPGLSQGSACSGSFKSGTLGCGCVMKNGSYVMEYNFIAHEDYRAWWRVDIQCFDARFVQDLVFNETASCHNLSIVPVSSEADITTSTTDNTNSPDTNTNLESGTTTSANDNNYDTTNNLQSGTTSAWTIASGAVGVVVTVSSIILVAVLINKKRQRHTAPPSAADISDAAIAEPAPSPQDAQQAVGEVIPVAGEKPEQSQEWTEISGTVTESTVSASLESSTETAASEA